MRLNSGKGDITIKNVQLLTPVCQKLTAVRHCAKKGYWIVTHKYGIEPYISYHQGHMLVSPIHYPVRILQADILSKQCRSV
jgi:hypothetical protein